MIKATLKKIKPIYFTYSFMKMLVQNIGFQNKIRKIRGRNIYDSIIKVGFIVQLPSIWEKQISVYEEIKKRKQMEVFLFVVPDYDLENGCNSNIYKPDNFFLRKYPDAVKIYNHDSIISIEDFNLDYLFYPRPYDHYLPESIRSTSMSDSVRCCYIPYGLSGSDTFNGGNIYNGFFNNMYFCFMDSEYQKELLSKEYWLNIKLRYKKIEYYGYPALEEYLSFPERKHKNKSVTWTPRWSYDAQIGGSNFIEYKDLYVQMISDCNCCGIFRPHPLMFDELEKKNIFSESEREVYFSNLLKANISMDIDSPINEILKNTDILITDFSTIIIQFFLTNRPIIYCDKGIELNCIYKELMQYIYVAHNWEEVEEFVKMLQADIDPQKDSRAIYIEKKYKKNIDAKTKIVDAIIADYEEAKK